MNAVGIDVSKGRSTVAILRPFGEVVRLPFDVTHNQGSLEHLAEQIPGLDGGSRVLLEATGRYHEPVAAALHEHGLYVSVLNPLAIHGYNPDGKVRKVKTDRKDSMKIAKFVLDHWTDLREYTPMDFDKFQKRHGIPHRKFHALRHTSGTLLLWREMCTSA